MLNFILCILFLFLLFFTFYLFLERGTEGERERRKHWCTRDNQLVASHMSPTGDMAHNPGMCPDWELNRWPFGLQAPAQSTEPHQPGQYAICILIWMKSAPKTVLRTWAAVFKGQSDHCQRAFSMQLKSMLLGPTIQQHWRGALTWGACPEPSFSAQIVSRHQVLPHWQNPAKSKRRGWTSKQWWVRA